MKKLLLLAFTTVLMLSCEKYEEGGLKRKAEDRLSENEWSLSAYLRNGTDESNSLLISGYTESYSSDGSYTRTYTDEDNQIEVESGQWQMDSDNDQIDISNIGSLELTEETNTVSASDYNILKLKDGELWYSFQNGGDTHEFRLTSN
jgi:hypothetical protein